MRVGIIIDGTDHFALPIERMLEGGHRTERFAPHFVRLPLIGKRVNDWRLVNQLRRFINRQDVVFFEWALALTALASRVPAKTKRVLRIHRGDLFEEHLEDFNWDVVAKIIFVSRAMQSRFLHKFPELSDKTTVIYNGVDLSRFTPRTRQFAWRIGMLGNLIPRKRVYDIICALADLPSSVPWCLEVGGAPLNTDLDYWEALQSLVLKLGIEKRIRFTGLVEDSAFWMQGIDVFVSASYSEGHQVSLIEAMASGCYCLCHCWDGIEEVLPPENIFTTDSELRAQLLAYASLSEFEKIQAQARMRTIAEKRFDERRMVEDIVTLIENAAQ